jgi:hypothetical protein
LLVPLLIKFRVSAHNLEIKKGRYRGVKTEDRICKLCNTGVEDETHFLLKSLSLNKEHSSELVFLIIKLSSDDINHNNFDLFGRLLKFVFTLLILLIIWVLLFSKNRTH